MTKGHETYNQLTRDKGRELVYMGETDRGMRCRGKIGQGSSGEGHLVERWRRKTKSHKYRVRLTSEASPNIASLSPVFP